MVLGSHVRLGNAFLILYFLQDALPNNSYAINFTISRPVVFRLCVVEDHIEESYKGTFLSNVSGKEDKLV